MKTFWHYWTWIVQEEIKHSKNYTIASLSADYTFKSCGDVNVFAEKYFNNLLKNPSTICWKILQQFFGWILCQRWAFKNTDFPVNTFCSLPSKCFVRLHFYRKSVPMGGYCSTNFLVTNFIKWLSGVSWYINCVDWSSKDYTFVNLTTTHLLYLILAKKFSVQRWYQD